MPNQSFSLWSWSKNLLGYILGFVVCGKWVAVFWLLLIWLIIDSVDVEMGNERTHWQRVGYGARRLVRGKGGGEEREEEAKLTQPATTTFSFESNFISCTYIITKKGQISSTRIVKFPSFSWKDKTKKRGFWIFTFLNWVFETTVNPPTNCGKLLK